MFKLDTHVNGNPFCSSTCTYTSPFGWGGNSAPSTTTPFCINSSNLNVSSLLNTTPTFTLNRTK